MKVVPLDQDQFAALSKEPKKSLVNYILDFEYFYWIFQK